MFTKFHVLMIHNDKEKSQQIADYLTEKDYECQIINNPKELTDDITTKFDCIILDDQFPKLNVSDFLAQTKLKSNPIIIVLTDAHSSQYLEQLLNSGADDYLTEPFELHDLDIKIQAVYKSGILKPRQIYRFKDIVLNITSQTCMCNYHPLSLTKNEFKLLSILISHPYQPFSTDYLFEQIWGSTLYDDGITISSLINSLMLKLRQANDQQDYIKRFGRDSYKMSF